MVTKYNHATKKLDIVKEIDASKFCDPFVFSTSSRLYVFEKKSYHLACDKRGKYLVTNLKAEANYSLLHYWLPKKIVFGGKFAGIENIKRVFMDGYVAFLFDFTNGLNTRRRSLMFLKVSGFDVFEERVTLFEVPMQVQDFRLVQDKDHYVAILICKKGVNTYLKTVRLNKNGRITLTKTEEARFDEESSLQNTLTLRTEHRLKVIDKESKIEPIVKVSRDRI